MSLPPEPYLPDNQRTTRLGIEPLSREDTMQTILGNGGEIPPDRINEAVQRHRSGETSSNGVRAGLLGRIGLFLRGY